MYKAGVIGLGKMGLMYDMDTNLRGPNSHSLAYEQHANIQLTAGHDPRLKQASFLKKISPNAFFYGDLDEMLREEKFDIVSVCTPPNQHYSNIAQILACQTPKLIFCEKPVVMNKNEAFLLKALLAQHSSIFMTNFSRRWNSGTQTIISIIDSQKYGSIEKIHIRYTRGINNTGSHIFDLIRMFGQRIGKVRALYQVETSADLESDPSYTFDFETDQGVRGMAEAFNDGLYYLFEMDFFMKSGKIEFRLSGDHIDVLEKGAHPLFAGFSSLHSVYEWSSLLQQSNLTAAMDHMTNVLNKTENPISTLNDDIYPLFVAEALIRSFQNHSSIELVGDEWI